MEILKKKKKGILLVERISVQFEVSKEREGNKGEEREWQGMGMG